MKNLLTVACFVILPLSSTAQGDLLQTDNRP